MQRSGTFTLSCPTRVLFGNGMAKELIPSLPKNCKSVVVVTGASGVAAVPVLRELHQSGMSITQIKCATEPSIPSISAALQKLSGVQPNAIVACGGGSAIDTGKLLTFLLSNKLDITDDFERYDPDLLSTACTIPFLAIPTTAGTGAEVTANAVVSVPAKEAKVSLRGRALNPSIAIVDPVLMRSGPAQVVLRSGLDAITQVIEAYTSIAATPFSDGLSQPSIEKGLNGLRGVMGDNDNQAWVDLAWVSLSSGMALANAGLGAAHGLAAVIGGRYEAPHGALCGRLLVPVMRRNLACSEPGTVSFDRHTECMAIVARVFPPQDGLDQLSGFESWMRYKNLPRLSDWGVRATSLDELAISATQASSSKKNATPLTADEFRRILEDAL